MNLALRIAIPIAILAVGGAGVALLEMNMPRAQPRDIVARVPTVNVLLTEATEVAFTVRSQGNVEPRTEIDLVPEVSGRVVEVSPSLVDGGRFGKGDVLVRIDPTDFDLAITQQKAAIARAELRIAQEEAEARSAVEQWRRLGLNSEPSPLVLRVPQLAEARANLAAAEAALAKAKVDRGRCELVTPFDGRVRSRSVDAGQFVTAGIAIGRIYAVDLAEIRLPIPDAELAFLDLPLDFQEQEGRSGPAVHLTAAFGGKTWEWLGRVHRTQGTIDVKTRQVVLIVRVEQPQEAENPSGRPPLAVGMFVEAEIEGRRVQGVVEIPRYVVRYGNQVLVVEEDENHRSQFLTARAAIGTSLEATALCSGSPVAGFILHLVSNLDPRVVGFEEKYLIRFREIHILRTNRNTVIVDAGLSAGERVCTTQLEIATDGMAVRVLQEDPAENR